jgi:hypothetical protein
MIENVTHFYLNNKPWPIKIMLLPGTQYNYWTVLGDAIKTSTTTDGKKRLYVRCKCVCNRKQYVRKDDLLSGKSKSCGCSRSLKIYKLEGKKFNLWTILKIKDVRDGHRFVTCQCDCGNTKDVRLTAVKFGRSKGCGCTKKVGRVLLDDIVGEEFGHLVALEVDYVHKDHGAYWKCLCKKCGNEKVVSRSNLTSGNSVSCGCWRGKNRKIARLLGYNESTVSLVLRNKYRDKPRIKPEMVTKIKNLAKEIGYKPGYILHT